MTSSYHQIRINYNKIGKALGANGYNLSGLSGSGMVLNPYCDRTDVPLKPEDKYSVGTYFEDHSGELCLITGTKMMLQPMSTSSYMGSDNVYVERHEVYLHSSGKFICWNDNIQNYIKEIIEKK